MKYIWISAFIFMVFVFLIVKFIPAPNHYKIDVDRSPRVEGEIR